MVSGLGPWFDPSAMIASALLHQRRPSVQSGPALALGLVIISSVVLSAMLLASSTHSRREELLSGYYSLVPAPAPLESIPVSKIYDDYRSAGKWSWDIYAGDAPSTSYGPSFHIHPAAPAPLGAVFRSRVQPPAANHLPLADDDTDNNLYDSWTGGWANDN